MLLFGLMLSSLVRGMRYRSLFCCGYCGTVATDFVGVFSVQLLRAYHPCVAELDVLVARTYTYACGSSPLWYIDVYLADC